MSEEKIINDLTEWGCDTHSALERMLDDPEFYCECLSAFLEDTGIGDLKGFLASEDVTKSFECAHTLKGVIGNLGITPMYETVCSIVEPLRAGSANGLMPLYETLCAQLEKLKNICAGL